MEKRIANVITYFFHPLLIPSYGIAVLWTLFSSFYFIRDLRIPLLLFTITLVSTCILPALSIYLLMKAGRVKDQELTDRRDRLLPYLITALYYYFAYSMLDRFPVPSTMLRIIRLFILGGAASILMTAGINLFWKISAHTLAIGGLSGAILALNYLLPVSSSRMLYIALFCSGLVGYSRLRLMAHTPSQVYLGFLIGFVSMLGLIYFI